jgi:HK97 family phage major capsid protein
MKKIFKEAFYANTNANAQKRNFARRMLFCMGLVAFIAIGFTAMSINKNTSAGDIVNGLSMAVTPLVLTKGANETDEQFAERQLLQRVKEVAAEELEKFKTANPTFDVSKITNIETALKELSTKAELNALKNQLEEIGLTVKGLTEKGENTGKRMSVKEWLKENVATIKQIANRVSEKELVSKALLLRSAIDGNQNAFDLPEIGQIATRKLSLYDIFPKLQLGTGNHNGTIRYYDWDEATIARAAAAVAEGAAFPESTAKFKKYSISVQKIGDTLPVTEEFFEDEQLFAAELEMFLRTNVDLEVDRQLYEGDGTGNQIIGIKSSIDAYTLPAAGSIVAPNLYDLAVKVAEQITTTGGSKFSPDVMLANSATINRMKLTKDANQNYVLPPFVSREGNQVSTMIVIPCDIMEDNEMIIGDRRFGRIYEIAGLTISKGTVGSQFTEDEMTLKVRKRLAFLVRNCDAGAFRLVEDIDAALTALTLV